MRVRRSRKKKEMVWVRWRMERQSKEIVRWSHRKKCKKPFLAIRRR